MPVRIRQLRQSDVGAVSELDARIQGTDRSHTWDQYLKRVLPLVDFDLLPHPPWGCFVADDGGSVVGFILSERQTPSYGLPPGARIVAVGVDPNRRREGIGAMLVDALVSECRRLGVDEIFAVMQSSDGRDVDFLQAQGFSTTDVTVVSKRVGPG